MTKLIDRAIELLKKPVPDTCGGVYKALAPDSRINFDLLPADTEIMFCEANCKVCGCNIYISSAALYLLAQAYSAVQAFYIPNGPYSSAVLRDQIIRHERQWCGNCDPHNASPLNTRVQNLLDAIWAAKLPKKNKKLTAKVIVYC